MAIFHRSFDSSWKSKFLKFPKLYTIVLRKLRTNPDLIDKCNKDLDAYTCDIDNLIHKLFHGKTDNKWYSQ